MASHPQDHVHSASLRNPEAFWAHQAKQLHWHKQPSRTLNRFSKELANGLQHPSYTWFPHGQISTTFNCLDRHVIAGNGNSTAIIWRSPVAGDKEEISYNQLLHEVETLAGVLREEGVKKGDVVLVYSVCDLQASDNAMLSQCSAHDTRCALCHACDNSSWSHPYSGLWRICSGIAGSEDRSI